MDVFLVWIILWISLPPNPGVEFLTVEIEEMGSLAACEEEAAAKEKTTAIFNSLLDEEGGIFAGGRYQTFTYCLEIGPTVP